MIRDRGNSKWQGMMLPEHVKALEMWRESESYIERLELNEWELQSIQEELELAYRQQCEAMITIWRKGKEFTYSGKVMELDHRLHLLVVEGAFGEKQIPIGDVVRMRCMG